MLSIGNESAPDEPLEEPDEDVESAPADRTHDPRVRWIYTPDMSSETGWEAYPIRPPAPPRRPAGFRPVTVRRDDEAGRSR